MKGGRRVCPRHRAPLLLATPLTLSPPVLHALYRDRWPVEQLPLAARQMLGKGPVAERLRGLFA